MMKILAIIQARTDSTRLHGKVLLPLEDKTVLEHIIERIRKSRLIDKTITKYLQEDADYTSNQLIETYPDGLAVEIFTFRAMR